MITLNILADFQELTFAIFFNITLLADIVFLDHTSIAQERTLLFVEVYLIEH